MTAANGVPAAQSAMTEVRPTPAAARPAKSLLLPAFWLVVVLLAFGGVRVILLMQDAFVRYPAATALAIVLFGLYAVPFWIFVSALDYLEREPALLQVTAFAWGALVATSTAIPGSAALHNLLAKLISPQFAAEWGPAIAGPTIEEILKTLGVVAIVLIARAQVNSVLDGVVYGALVGLGFQVVEDIVYAISAVTLIGHGDQVGPVVATFFLRGFLAGLWSHTLFSALAGAGIGYLVVRTDRPMWIRLAAAVGAWLGAWLCHFVWNSPLLADGFGYGGGWGVLGALVLKGIPPLLMILLLIRVARHREGNYYVAQLARLNDSAVATPRELWVLCHGHLRAQARRHAYARSGVRGRRMVRRLQRAQARLAVALSRAADADRRATAGPRVTARPERLATASMYSGGLVRPTGSARASGFVRAGGLDRGAGFVRATGFVRHAGSVPDAELVSDERLVAGASARVVDVSDTAEPGAVGCGEAGGPAPVETAEVTRWRDEVLYQRSRLVAIGHPEGIAPDERSRGAWAWLSSLAVVIVGILVVAAIWAAIRALGGS